MRYPNISGEEVSTLCVRVINNLFNKVEIEGTPCFSIIRIIQKAALFLAGEPRPATILGGKKNDGSGDMFKKIFISAIVFLLICQMSFAFPFDVNILDQTAIVQLSDEQLRNAYIDAAVEVEALKAFYAKGGLIPKEYKSFKDVLRYRILLLDELQKRKLEIPGNIKTPLPKPEVKTEEKESTKIIPEPGNPSVLIKE